MTYAFLLGVIITCQYKLKFTLTIQFGDCMMISIRLVSMILGITLAAGANAKTINIAIGHQSMCTDTYTAGIVVKELKLLEKH